MVRIIDVKGLGQVRSWGLSSYDYNKVGKECKCLSCGNTFIAGNNEIVSRLIDEDSGKQKDKIEVCFITDIEDVNWKRYQQYLKNLYLEDARTIVDREGIKGDALKAFKKEVFAKVRDIDNLLPENPEDWYFFDYVKAKDIPAELSLKDKAVLMGIEKVNSKVCPMCSGRNKTKEDDLFCHIGKGSGSVSGEIENN